MKFVYASLVLGIISCMAGIFYNYTLQNGAVFSRLGEYLSVLSSKGGIKGFIANPLGDCIYCSTTWITVLILTLYWVSTSVPPNAGYVIISYLTGIGVQHVLLRIWDKLDL